MNDEVTTTISMLLPGVPMHFLPSVWQYDRFKEFVDWAGGADPSGNFNGHCVMHDREKTMIASAVYNFDRGVLRCQGEPSCHSPKRAMSLVNALKKADAR